MKTYTFTIGYKVEPHYIQIQANTDEEANRKLEMGMLMENWADYWVLNVESQEAGVKNGN